LSARGVKAVDEKKNYIPINKVTIENVFVLGAWITLDRDYSSKIFKTTV